MAKRKRHRSEGQAVPVGKREENSTPLWVECQVCGGSGPTIQRDCTCRQGYVETGFTQERFDTLIKENDRLLVLIDDLSKGDMDLEVRRRVNRLLESHSEAIEAARSRVKE